MIFLVSEHLDKKIVKLTFIFILIFILGLFVFFALLDICLRDFKLEHWDFFGTLCGRVGTICTSGKTSLTCWRAEFPEQLIRRVPLSSFIPNAYFLAFFRLNANCKNLNANFDYCFFVCVWLFVCLLDSYQVSENAGNTE